MIEFNYISVIFTIAYFIPFAVALWLEALNLSHLQAEGGKVPAGFKSVIDEHKLERITNYTIDKSLVGIIRTVIIDLIVYGLIIAGFFVMLDRWVADLAADYFLAGTGFFIALALLFFVLDIPFDLFNTFVVEQEYGFNRAGPGLWLTDNLKGLGISILLIAVTIPPILWLIRTFPEWWWILGFAFAVVIQLCLTVLYPVLIAPLFNKFEPLDDERLAEKVENLVRRVGFKPRGVYRMDAGRRSAHSNAYFTGLGKTKRIVLFDTLLESHTHDEILAVLAHEAGHFKRKHILKSFLLSAVVMFVGFYVTYALLNWAAIYRTFHANFTHPWIGLFLIGIFLRRVGFAVRPVASALSRKFERESDDFAAELMQSGAPLVEAFKKMASHNLANLNPHPLYVRFNYSHPPLPERVERLESR